MATGAVIPIDVRLLWGGVPTLHVGSATRPLHHGFAIGSSFDVTVEGTPGSLLLAQIALGLQPPLNLPPLVGEWRLGGAGFSLPMLPVSPQGRSSSTLPIPNEPTLIGLWLAFQGVTLDAVSSVLQITNATDCYVDA